MNTSARAGQAFACTIPMVLLLTMSLAAGVQARTEEGQGMVRRLDAAVNHAIEEGTVVGTVVVVLRDGTMVYHRAAGFADREAGRPMREDTLFRFASLSKPIVTVALLRLVEEGKLNLDDPVTKYLPNFRPKLADGSVPVITLHQLLTHTAGLSSDFFKQTDIPLPGCEVSRPTLSGSTIVDELNRIQAVGLSYAPGKSWGYSLGIDVLGMVLEQVTGKPLADVVSQLVTSPAAMANTGFQRPDPDRLATPYGDGDPPGRMSDPCLVPVAGHAGVLFSPGRIFDTSFSPTAGSSMSGSARDMARLLELIRIGGGGLIRPESARTMMENHIGRYSIVDGPGWGFGYGGAVLIDPQAARTPQSPGTWKWGGVWGHTWFVDPKLGLVVVSLTNTALEGVSGHFPEAIRDAVYGHSFR
nr:serine hydrolase domain-containing protein [uncultured Desulfobulbus sp.]